MFRSTSHLAIACACLNTKQKRSKLTTEDIARRIPRLGLVVSLTNTQKYYRLDDWTRYGIEYKWIKTEGELVGMAETDELWWLHHITSSIHSEMERIRNHNNQFKAHSKVTTVHTGISIINALHLSSSMRVVVVSVLKRLVWTTWRKKKRSCQSMAKHKNSQKRKKETDAVLMSLWHGIAHDEDDKVVLCVRRVAFSFTSFSLMCLCFFYFHFKFTSGIHLKTSLFNASFCPCLPLSTP